MEKPTKKRTLNELRQSKPFGYKPPKSYFDFVKGTVNFDNHYISDLIKKYPNDTDLGKELRKYYLNLKNNKNFSC
tara:strand:- start:511 stop:735 length:225 start_codon:yes stop_codon:yes gene_type:complete